MTRSHVYMEYKGENDKYMTNQAHFLCPLAVSLIRTHNYADQPKISISVVA